MKKVLSISLGELTLKGRNRIYFENELTRQIRRAIRDLGFENIYKDQGKIYIEAGEDLFPQMIARLKKVFGLVYISPCIRIEKDMEKIEEAVLKILGEKQAESDPKTFKVVTNRVDKKFLPKSPEISRHLGGLILKNTRGLKVDVHKPDIYVYVDIKEEAYVYIDRFEGVRGMPLGTAGKGLLLLSGGIDSPVAGYLMAKRGVKISALHFHSYPFTSERAEEKVKDLASIMSRYMGNIRVYSVNILNVQKAIKEHCPASEMTILSRRFMMRIAERISRDNRLQAIVTGESLGQVASQTMESMSVINKATDMPILRPLIAMDKVDIIDIARDIETYETSIIPFVDSCTVFLPDNPVIKPLLRDIEESESRLDIDYLVGDAVENMKVYNID